MISIIVPVYNSENTLGRCVDSLISQSYSDIEIIIVIDGSTDNSEKIARAYTNNDSRIKLIIMENEGVSAARNAGLQNAIGEYVLFIDSDDYVSSKMCEKLIDVVEKNAAQMVLCGFHHLFLDKDIIKSPKDGIYNIDEFSGEFLKLYNSGFLNMPWNKLLNREYIKEYFDKSISLGEDLLFNIAYMRNIKRIAIVSEPFYYYVQNSGQDTLSSQKRTDKYDIAVRICESIKCFYREFNKNPNTFNEADKVINTRFILEFLDEIEGMAYDNTISKGAKLELINKYMTDEYIISANKNIEKIQIDYKIINFFFKRKCKNIVYVLIYIRKMLLKVVRRS